MKLIITGSLGNISRPLTQQLIAAGHDVTVISSSDARIKEIEALGAKAAIGSLHDRNFLERAFAGADAAYLMIPPDLSSPDIYSVQVAVADNYVAAVTRNKIRNVVLLSSSGADLGKETGPVDGIAYFEKAMEKTGAEHLCLLRPAYFYYNFHGMAGMLKHANIMGSNFGNTEEKLALAAPSDIAEAAADALLHPSAGKTIRYIASDERHPTEIASVLGAAVGKPSTPWIVFSDDESLQGLQQNGFSENLASAYTIMGKSLRDGLMQRDYWKNRPSQLGKVKLEEFAKEFAAVYAKL